MDNYLSEVFLGTVGMEFTEEKVREGLRKCGELLEKRLMEIPTETGKLLYFFDTDGKGNKGREHFQEMLDLWDVISEYADDEKFRDYEIVMVCRTIYDIYRTGR